MLAGNDECEGGCPDASAWPFSDPRVWLIYQYYLSQYSCPKCACAAFGNLDWLPPRLKARIAEMTAQMGGAPLGLSPTGCLPVGTLSGVGSLSGCARCAARTPGQLHAIQRMQPMPKNATFLMLRRRPAQPRFYVPFGGRLRGLGASADVFASLTAAQQQAVQTALYSFIIQAGACPNVFTGSGTSTPSGQGINSAADLADPSNRGIAVDCFQQGYNATNSTTLGAVNGPGVLDAQTYAALMGAPSPAPPNPVPNPVPVPTPPAPAATTSSNTGLIVGVAAAALIGGGILAYALTRPKAEPARATATTTSTTRTTTRRRARA